MTHLSILHSKLRNDSSMLVAQAGGNSPSAAAHAAHCLILRKLRGNPGVEETKELAEFLNGVRARISCSDVKSGRQSPGRVTREKAAQVIANKTAAKELAAKAKLAMSLAAQRCQDQEIE